MCSRVNGLDFLDSLQARDKNELRDAPVGSVRSSAGGGSAPLRGGEWPRGTLSKSL